MTATALTNNITQTSVVSSLLSLLFILSAFTPVHGENNAEVNQVLFSCDTPIGQFLNNLVTTPCEGTLRTEDHDENLKVMFGGLGRMGSGSLTIALKKLGYKVCHGADLPVNPKLHHVFIRDMDGSIDEILDLTRKYGYNATGEWHSILFRKIVKVVPDVKVIVPKRDFESWYKSWVYLLDTFQTPSRFPLSYLPPLAEIRLSLEKYNGIIAKNREHGINIVRDPYSLETKKILHQAFDEHFKDIRDAIPEKNRITFSFEDGYPALCAFLDVDEERCPKEPYPHVNSTKEMTFLYITFRVIEFCVYCLFGAVAHFLLRCCRVSRSHKKTD